MFADIISEEDAELAALQECTKCALIAVNTRMFSHCPPDEHALLNDLPKQLGQQIQDVIKKRFRLRQKVEEPVPEPAPETEPEPKEEPKNLKPALDIFLTELQRDIASGNYLDVQANIKQFIHFIQDKHIVCNPLVL